MTTATKHVTVTAKAPNAKGTFEGTIFFNPPNGDFDGERISEFTNLPGEVALMYSHSYTDPGAEIGVAKVIVQQDNQHLTVLGKLDLTNPIARAVFERMLLPSGDKMALKELSVGFGYDRSENTRDPNGVVVLHNVELLEVSIVYSGAQETAITSVKNRVRVPDNDRRLGDRVGSLEREALLLNLDALREKPRRRTDAQLDAQIDVLLGKASAGGNITPATASLLMSAANRLVNSAVRSQVAGLVDAEGLLMAASRDLRAMASGGEGDVETIIASLRPIVSELRAVNSVAASNLERTLIELAGGVAVEYADNSDRVEGSVNVTTGVTDGRDRYQPKGRWTHDVPQRFIPKERA
jgi:HK97 family phage prohead protease